MATEGLLIRNSWQGDPSEDQPSLNFLMILTLD